MVASRDPLEVRLTPPWRSAAWVLAAFVIAVASQAIGWLDPVLGTVDHEEGFNAAISVIGPWVGLENASALQYKPFCHGCMVNAGVGWALFGMLGESPWVWKLVPASLFGLSVGVIAQALRMEEGPKTAALLVVCCAVSPPILLEIGSRGYGTHFEAGWMAVACLIVSVRARAAVGCLALGAAAVGVTWYCLSGAWVLAAIPMSMIASGRRAASLSFGGGAALGALAWWAVGDAAGELTGLMSYSSALEPHLGGLAPSTGPLDRCNAWAMALSGFPGPWRGALGWLALLGAVGSIGVVATGERTVRLTGVALCGGWVALALAYGLAPLQLPSAPGSAFAARYAVPAAQLACVTVAVASARLWRAGRPAIAGVLVLIWAASGTVVRTTIASDPEVAHLWEGEVVPWTEVREVLLTRRGIRRATWSCGDDPRCDYSSGFNLGRSAVEQAGCAWVDPPDSTASALGRHGWRHGAGRAVGSCSPGEGRCTRWCTARQASSTRDPRVLLAMAEGVVAAGGRLGDCEDAELLDAVSLSLNASGQGRQPPPRLTTHRGREVWEALYAARGARRFGGATARWPLDGEEDAEWTGAGPSWAVPHVRAFQRGPDTNPTSSAASACTSPP